MPIHESMMYRSNSPLLAIVSILPMLILAACATNAPISQPSESKPAAETMGPTEDCPIVDSRNWHAWVDRPDGIDGKARLNLVGQLDLPTPGFSVSFEPGVMDRRNPPALRVQLSAVRPAEEQGMTIQVISSEDVDFQMPSPVLKYRAVLVVCGTRLLAEIPDVVLTD